MAQGIRETLVSRLNGANLDEMVDILCSFLTDRGQSNYDESVTQLEHALQCAALAAENGCSDDAVTAALFHDIGHLLLDEHAAKERFLSEDLNHEAAGANLLAKYFPPAVTEPIRLHVAAKRYLCTTDPAYYDQLSDASKRSFQVQGGNLSDEERAALESNPGLDTALKLRRFDDLGKKSGLATPGIEVYKRQIRSCLRQDS